MAQQVHITYYGMDGIGRTVTEAKKDAGAKIERLVKELTGPTMGVIHGVPCCLWRDRGGWSYQILSPDSDHSFVKRWGSGRYETAAEAEASMRYSLAQDHCLDQDWEQWRDELPSRELRHDLERYRRWQLDYKRLRAEGKTDSDAHALASWN